MLKKQPPVLGFAAYSGVGKTSLLTRLLPLLKANGLRVGVIKYSHHNFDIDVPGKDSHKLRQAGATPVMLVSPYRQAIITEYQPTREIELQEQIAEFPDADLDLILVEGFKEAAFNKIELHRPSLEKPLLFPHDKHIIAIASDEKLSTPDYLPCLDLNDTQAIANFIQHVFLRNPA
jgi:molybdopterin-guanine dinucleotide biosynthesis adapter protein